MDRWAKIGAGVLLLWYGVLRGAKALQVGLQSYSFSGIDLTNGTVSLTLNIYVKNPLLVGVTLKAVQGDVYVQGEKVGYVNTAIDYYLSGGRTHILPIVVNLTFAGAAKGLIANIQSGDIHTLTMTFDGKVFVGNYNVGVPVKIDLDYNDLTA